MLRGDGLGVVTVGDPMDSAVAALAGLLGSPSFDQVTEAPFGDEGEMGSGMMACWTATGTTCIDYLRVVGWDGVGLWVLFSDWTRSAPSSEDWEPEPAPPNLRGYEYRGGPDQVVLSTYVGVTVDSTVGDLVEAYGDALTFSYDECAFNIAGFYVVDLTEYAGYDGHNSGIDWGLWGEFSGLPDSPEATLVSIGAGSLLGYC